METSPQTRCTAFAGGHRIASGELRHVALLIRKAMDRDPRAVIHVFDDRDGRRIEIDLRGSVADLLKRIAAPGAGVKVASDRAPVSASRNGPGRPRLGVVAREVTLLPRHWQWLSVQPGGASVALRTLLDDAHRRHAGGDRRRAAQDATYRFMAAMAADAPGFDDAARALFAADAHRFEEYVAQWPDDIREHAQMLAADVFRQA